MFLNQIIRFKVLKHKLIRLKGEISKSTILLMNFNTPLIIEQKNKKNKKKKQ